MKAVDVGNGYEQWICKFGDDRLYLQAIELDTPNCRQKTSERFMFVDVVPGEWERRLTLFTQTLTKAATHALTLANVSHGVSARDAWPPSFKDSQCPNDMPVVARGLELIS